MTGMVLSIGALLGSQVVSTVQAAMQGITTEDVWTWCPHLGPTVQSIRRRITQALNQEQQKPLCPENG